MKHSIFIILGVLFLGFNSALCQNNDFSTQQQYYFDDYQKAEIYTKEQQRTTQLKLNYNVLLDEMHYVKNDTKLRVGNIQDIEFIKFASDIFVIFKKEYYRLVYAGEMNKIYLQMDPDLSVLNKPSEGAYGTSNATSSAKRMSAIEERTYFLTILSEVSKDQEIKIPVNERLYIYHEDELVALTKRNIYKLYPNYKKEIKNYIKAEDISLRNEEQVQLLFEFCSKLKE